MLLISLGIIASRMVRNHLHKRPLFLDAMAVLKHSSSVDAEFNSLEAKVAQFVGLCERLRAENHDLRQQLASAIGHRRTMSAVLWLRSKVPSLAVSQTKFA